MASRSTHKKRKEYLQWFVILIILTLYAYHESNRKEELRKRHTAEAVIPATVPSYMSQGEVSDRR